MMLMIIISNIINAITTTTTTTTTTTNVTIIIVVINVFEGIECFHIAEMNNIVLYYIMQSLGSNFFLQEILEKGKVLYVR